MFLGLKRNLWLSFSISALTGFAFFLGNFYFSPYLKSLGFSGQEIGIIFALQSISAILFVIPAGFSSDKFSPKYIALPASFLLIVFSIILAFVQSFWLLCLFVFTFGASYNALKTSINTEVFKDTIRENAGKIFGIYHFTGAFAVGAAMILGGLILDSYSFSYIFLLSGIIFTFIFIASFRLSALPTVDIDLKKNFSAIKRKNVLIFSLILFLFALHWGAEATSYGLFLKENLGLTNGNMGFYMAGENLFLGASALFFGFILQKEKISLKKILILGLFLSGITHILMCIENVPLSAFFRMIHGIGDGIMVVFMFFGIRRFFEVERIGGNSSIIMFITLLAGFTGSLVFGPLGENMGYQYPLIISGIVALLAIPLVFCRGLRF